MATLQWDHAVQFVNQPEAAIEIFAGQQLRAVAGGGIRGGEPVMR